ncbi:MAG TPA: hypothetical protein VMU89_13120 [Thermomicrobiaceae bacterium]|nr:hypothetical protein [Thermomicrobiaceae bacterium]
MSAVTATPAPVVIRTSPTDLPSVPAWFAEVAVLAHHFARRGLLDAISQQVQLARGRAGRYAVSDFVALLLGYAVSGEPTLAAFCDRLTPFAGPFMALFGRDRQPHRATLSRFLAAVDAPCLEALRGLFAQDLGAHGFAGDHLGGLFDRQGQRLLIIDVDGTRQAARQRALAGGDVLPPCRRRLARVCAPGYLGRKRGEVVRTRTTVLQAHTQQWLGTFAGAGNGDYVAELEAACRAVTAYLQANGVPPSQALLRLDGLYGSAAALVRVQQVGLGFLVRGRTYHLLDHPVVRERLARPPDATVTHPESGVRRAVYDAGYLTEWVEPGPERKLTYRVIVTGRAAPSEPEETAVGTLRDGHVYELFLTSHPAHRLTAVDVLDLFHQRGAFEQVLSDEDAEQDPDRWCSQRPAGQEFWQVLSQWVWNTRLELGQVCSEAPLRWTCWSDGQPVAPPTMPPPTPPREEPIAEEVVALYGPLQLARAWAKANGRFAGTDFAQLEDGTLRCPAGKLLRVRERRELINGDVRLMFGAKVTDCRTCAERARCLGQHASGANPRRVSALRPLTGRYARPVQPPWKEPELPDGSPDHSAAPRDLLWCDAGGRRLRRDLVQLLRRQTVRLDWTRAAAAEEPLSGVPEQATRAARAHRRLSWATRLARNATTTRCAASQLTLFGIPPRLAGFLSLPSVPGS